MEINNLNSIDDLLNHFKAKRENISAFITNVIKKNDYKCKPNFCMKRTIGNCDLGKCIFDSHVKDDWKGKDKYQFLYWLEDNINDDPNAKYIKAKDIQSACKIFLDKKPKSLRRVDYEVRFNDDFINISDMKEFENYF